MHRSFTLLFLLVLGTSIALVPSVKGDTDEDTSWISLEKRYKNAKIEFNRLEGGSTNSAPLESWVQSAKDFRKIYLAEPSSEYAPGCLFMLGKIYQRMYARSHNKQDIDKAISFYNDLSSLFPENKLADDSLLAVANIYLETLHDQTKAVEVLNRIVKEYPNGDMYPQAINKLNALPHDQMVENLSGQSDNPQTIPRVHVLPVKYWSSHDYTRIVIDTSGPVVFKEQLLEQVGDQPRRLYIDFSNSYIEPQYRAPVPIEDGLLKRIRSGQNSADTVRVVLDIESISSYKVFSLPDPFRVVVDVRGQNKNVPSPAPAPAPAPAAVNAPTPPPPEVSQPVEKPQQGKSQEQGSAEIIVLHDSKKKPATAGMKKSQLPSRDTASSHGKSISLAQQLGLRVKKIVLDPGHGGKDPGAMAHNLKEKDIVLKVAKKLAPILEKRLGCKVMLTRTKDVFIPLEERTAFANKNDADLFISLHLNASQSVTASGIETYYLNLTSNPEAMRVAAYENATSTHQMSELQNILSDILKNSKINESSRLAQQVQNSIIAGLEKQFPNIKSLGVKQAPFYVLIGAEMPAVLVEMSFISNQNDAKNLKDDHFLSSMANTISSGIQLYINANTASL